MKKILLGALSLGLFTQVATADTCAKGLTNVFNSYQAAKLCATFVGVATISGALTFTGTGPIIAPTALALAVGAATTPNYTFDNAKLAGPSTMVFAASTAISLAPGSANTPTTKFVSTGMQSQLNAWVEAAPTSIALSAGAANTPNVTFDNAAMTFGTNAQGVRMVLYTITAAATPAEGTNDIKKLSIFPTAAANTAAIFPTAAGGNVGDRYRVCNSGPNTVRVKAPASMGINGGSVGTYIPLLTFQCADCDIMSSTYIQCDTFTVPTPAGP